MTRRIFIFDPPDRFVAGAVGTPGRRTFYLQARARDRIISVSLEKVQVAVLAERLDRLLDELERRGLVEATTESVEAVSGPPPLDEPARRPWSSRSPPARSSRIACSGSGGGVGRTIRARSAAARAG